MRYPAITKATITMARSNGGITRERSEHDVAARLDQFLSGDCARTFDLPAIDRWLSSLSDRELLAVVDGEQAAMAFLLVTAPTGTDRLLTHIFDEVV